jgi:hypothetical protein
MFPQSRTLGVDIQPEGLADFPHRDGKALSFQPDGN